MYPFEIFFLNNGDAVFQTEQFAHRYDNMAQMAQDFCTYQEIGSTKGWDGNEPESRTVWDNSMERNGSYLCVTEGCWGDLNAEWGRNTDNFLRHLENLGYQS